MNFDYQKICQELLKNIPQKRTRTIVERRFGLSTFSKAKSAFAKASAGQRRETLESIGKSYGISRERVRQIEEDGLSRIKRQMDNMDNKVKKVFQHFTKEIKASGNLVKEDILLNKLGGSQFSNQVFFLLYLSDQFKRFSGNKELFSLWATEENSLTLARQVAEISIQKLRQKKQLLPLRDFYSLRPKSSPKALATYLEISKIILRNSEGLYGLRDWPEINPRGVKDKAFLVFKKEKSPLHFQKVAYLIEGSLAATVHNELIKDPRFVLVGRGTYALKEWGYESGQVKDVIFQLLKKSDKPLTKERVTKAVLKQRLVQPNTVLLNLNDKKLFAKDGKGRYFVRTA